MDSDSDPFDLPFLVGNQVVLRQLLPSDVTPGYASWLHDDEVTRYMTLNAFPTTRDDLRAYVEKALADDDRLLLAITVEDEHVGNVELGPIDWLHRRAEVGILLGETEVWGEGIATEAIELLADHAFDQLNLWKLYADCHADNRGSAEAFKNAGFVEEGRRTDHVYIDGAYGDVVLHGLTRDAHHGDA